MKQELEKLHLLKSLLLTAQEDFLEIKEHLSTSPFVHSENPKDYVIFKKDYIRNNPSEKRFIKKYRNHILRVFNNRCAFCDTDQNNLDMDHYLLSKSHGGNFKLRHVAGELVCNAVPLCETCNRRKKTKKAREFISEERSSRILTKLDLISKRLNSERGTKE